MTQLKKAILGVASLFLLALLFATGSNISMAQTSASISGRIEDPSGAAIPGANVLVTSLETGAARTIVADDAGRYQVLSLPVGPYEVKADKAGFKVALQRGINLVIGQQAVVNLRLEVGAVQEQVTVTSDSQLVNTTTSSIAGLVGERQVKDLPINGRSFDLLLTLNPGTVNYTSMKQQGTILFLFGGNMFSVLGRRPGENLTLLNGVQYSGDGIALQTPGGASGLLLGVDAVREYNVVSGAYGAEHGQRAGAQITMVTQSGTNQLHGSLFEFLRNDKLDARNFFDTQGVPPFKRNQFGGALGGPIRKDKTFVFGNYEGFRQSLNVSSVTFVPDLNARKGLLPCGLAGGVTCVAGTAAGTPTPVPNLDPRSLVIVNNRWPMPNGPNLGGGVAIAYTNPLMSLHEDFGTIRVDQALSVNDNLSAFYTISDGNDIIPNANPVFAAAIGIRNQVASLQETHIFSPRVVNTFNAGFTRGRYLGEAAALVSLPASLSYVAGLLPGVLNSGGSHTSNTWNQSGLNASYRQWARNLFTYSDVVQVVKGRHQISAGAWLQRIQQNDDDRNNNAGQASFASLENLFAGIISNFQVSPTTPVRYGRQYEGAWYLQDSIQLRPNLTVRVGLRHEFTNNWSEATGLDRLPLIVPRQALVFVDGVLQPSPQLTLQRQLQNKSKWLLGPRLGLAWDPFGKGKTSIRAAFGIHYSLLDKSNTVVDPTLSGSLVFSNVSLFSLIPFDVSSPRPPPCSASVLTQCATYGAAGDDRSFTTPGVSTWNFSVEQQLTRGTALRVAYVGSHAYHSPLGLDPNVIAPQICSNPAGCLAGGVNSASNRSTVPQGTEYIPVGTRPVPFLANGSALVSQGIGNYNALQTEVVQRLTRGLMFRANHTWAKSLDNTSGTSQQAKGNDARSIMNSYDLRRDYGRSAFDLRHQVSGNFSYELPFGQGKAWLNGAHGVAGKLVSGWQLNGIVSLLSGLPFAIVAGSNVSGNGNTNNDDRPNWNPAFKGNPIKGTAEQWFDPAAFAVQPLGTFGNVSRNPLSAPGLAMVDFSLLKTTQISERVRLQFRAEVFNALNHTNFAYAIQAVFAGTAVNPTAGRISSTSTTSRQIQFGMKLVF